MNRYFAYLDQFDNKELVEKAKHLYQSIFENNFAKHLTVPDSIAQDAVNPQMPMHLVGTANGTSAPDVQGGNNPIQDTLARLTRGGDGNKLDKEDVENPDCMHGQVSETDDVVWQVPPFAKQFHSVPKNPSIDKLSQAAQDHLPNPLTMGVPYSTQPMQTGFTINSNWTNKYKPGVDAGYTSGGSTGGGSSAGGGNAG